MLLILRFILLIFLMGITSPLLAKPLYIITTSPDLADITRQLGGKHVLVKPLVKGSVDLHHFEPRPSMLKKLSKADCVIKIGMDYDDWVQELVQAAGNKKLLDYWTGVLDVSKGIPKRDVPHVYSKGGHRSGNPHYLHNPNNAFTVAKTISQRLIKLDPENKGDYEKNIVAFNDALRAKISVWKKASKKLRGKRAVSYHKTWTYLYDFLGIRHVATLEVQPDIPPTPKHLRKINKWMKMGEVDLVIQANYYSDKAVKIVTKGSMLTVKKIPLYMDSYAEYFDVVIEILKK